MEEEGRWRRPLDGLTMGQAQSASPLAVGSSRGTTCQIQVCGLVLSWFNPPLVGPSNPCATACRALLAEKVLPWIDDVFMMVVFLLM